MSLFATTTAKRGSNVDIGIAFENTPADTHVVHVDVLDPKGNRMMPYSGNLMAKQGRSAKRIPIALNDPSGQWTVRVRDILTGQTETRTIQID